MPVLLVDRNQAVYTGELGTLPDIEHAGEGRNDNRGRCLQHLAAESVTEPGWMLVTHTSVWGTMPRSPNSASNFSRAAD